MEPSRDGGPAPPFELQYPWGSGQAVGSVIDVAPGVKWLRLPLNGSIGFINVWAIDDSAGWTIVDTGLGDGPTREVWGAALAGPLGGRPVTRVIVTHMHPDHIGMSGWLTRRFGCRLSITRLEYLSCRNLASDMGRDAPEDALSFYRAAGWSADQIDAYRVQFGGFGKRIAPLPDSFQRIRDGDELRIGDRVWTVVVGAGHSPEHACLHCPELGLFISGDQVLPRISSNVSVYPTEPDANPLSDWLSSLRRIQGLTPHDVLVLPAHNDVFRGLHVRIEELVGGHERNLSTLRGLLREPRRVIDVFGALFGRPITEAVLTMATGEGVAHLNYLLARGEATRRMRDGVAWYEAAA